MGRKSLNNERKDNPKRKMEWVKMVLPHFLEKGIANLPMDEVAKILDKSKATIYKYFKSREEILELGMEGMFSEIMEFESMLNNKEIEFTQRYFMAINHLSQHIAGISILFLDDLKKLHPELWERVNSFRMATLAILKEYYKEGIDLKIFKNISPSLMIASDNYFFTIMADPDFLKENDLNMQNAFEQYFKMKLYGILENKR